MVKHILICIGCMVLFLTGCSGNEDNKEVKTATTSDAPKEKKAEETGIVSEIEKVTIPTTIEEWSELKPGILAKDFDYEHESSEWPSTVKEVKDEFTSEMEKVLKETKDDDMIFKSIIYLLGSNINQGLIQKQIALKGNFEAPYLPEPDEENKVEKSKKEVAPSKAILLLDASSSMLLQVDGEQKIEVAKTAVKRFAKTIGTKSDVSLYLYGHAGTQEDKDKQLSCSTIDEVYPLKKYNEKTFSEAVEKVQAKGWTPLAAAIKKVKEDSKNYSGDITVYIVSDGAETCGGDPVKEAKEFASENDAHKVNIIGFNVDEKSESQLKEVAKAGNGDYLSANNTEELNQSISKRWVPPSLLDVIGKQWSSPKMSGDLYGLINKAQMNYYGINRAAFVENVRYQSAIKLLVDEKMIPEEQGKRLDERLTNYKKQLNQLNEELSKQKKEELEAEADEIDKQINDWAKRMDELRKEQAGS